MLRNGNGHAIDEFADWCCSEPRLAVQLNSSLARRAAATKLGMRGLCASWRGAGPDLLNNLPTAVWLAFKDEYVTAFGRDFSAGGDSR